MRQLTSADVKTKARELGFDACGVAPAGDLPELEFFQEWIARGYAGSMAYLERSADRRAGVGQVMPSARTVIVTATVYNTARPYSTECADSSRAQIARYAWGDDYHDVIGARLDALIAWMREIAPQPFDARAYVDTGPVQERVYARHAGIGWIGKNTCVINPELGSWVFLGEIICSLPLDTDAPALDQCGDLHALSRGVSDAGARGARRARLEPLHLVPDDRASRRHSGGARVPPSDRTSMAAISVRKCAPGTASRRPRRIRRGSPGRAWDQPALVDLSRMPEDVLHAALRGSAMRRAKAAGVRRNVAIALENIETART